ncbi:hypothetical protein FHS13_000952 [Nocardiopsis algeriensis]|uniref:DUF6504 domain-containing protein n=1 Tax=Nocardiopsis algeriensis TaxID=1478215 RepID=A0A841IJX4_9ACTN|nr:hypothetical protein [Nocardiopsis algeriensis]
MGRCHRTEIAVTEDEGRPVRFTWNGRVYGVRRIIDHWVTLRTDWSPESSAQVPERRHWRVEAGAADARGVYELRHDTPTGRWFLSRVRG